MIDTFKRFLDCSVKERSDIFEATGRRLHVGSHLVEKDFWVCVVLNILFNGLQDHPALFFKGGTSLSKCFDLIDRFSEDIDLVVCRKSLGFGGDLSSNRQSKLRKECRAYIAGRLCDDLAMRLNEMTSGCRVTTNCDDPNNPKLFVDYPALYPDAGGNEYVHRRVVIEGGARSSTESSGVRSAQPYIADELEGWNFSVKNIRVISPERTFWEKILILHDTRHKYENAGKPVGNLNRLSRHYYDVAMIASKPAGAKALSSLVLLDDAREHAIKFFQNKVESARAGSIRLVPAGELRDAIEKDYAATGEMIIGNAPDFDWIMNQLKSVEERINSASPVAAA